LKQDEVPSKCAESQVEKYLFYTLLSFVPRVPP
jgi:hypothetical protein